MNPGGHPAPAPTRKEVERVAGKLEAIASVYPELLDGIATGGRFLLALLDRAEKAEADRDNWKAHAISRGKRLRKTRDEFIGIRDDLCDEGDRVYFGSTNHADAFKDAVEWLDDFAWDKIMGEPENWDLLGALEKSQAVLAEEAEKLRLAREHIELKCRERDAAREEATRLEEALREIEVAEPDADGIVWLKIKFPSGTGAMVNLGTIKRLTAQVGVLWNDHRRAALTPTEPKP